MFHGQMLPGILSFGQIKRGRSYFDGPDEAAFYLAYRRQCGGTFQKLHNGGRKIIGWPGFWSHGWTEICFIKSKLSAERYGKV